MHTHFMELAGVICPNSALLSRMAVYAASESSPLSVAVPKYFLPAAWARELSPEPEGAGAPVEVGGAAGVDVGVGEGAA